MVSPAHIALVFPILSHTNSVQAYRSGVDSFSNLSEGSPLRAAIFIYWFVFLIGGTLMNFIFTYHYMIRLPKWTNILETEMDDESLVSEPPQEILLEDTVLGHMNETEAHESLTNFTLVNPAVLQANEAGALVRIRRGTEDYERHGPYKRTRHVSALGFDPILSAIEFETERARLLEWAASNSPRRRHRTLSNPAELLARVNEGIPRTEGVYGSIGGKEDGDRQIKHVRSRTSLL